MAAWLLSCFVNMCVERCVFATWCCQTHCNGSINVAIVICHEIFSNLVLFLVRISFKSDSKSSFFLLWRRDPVLELQFLTPLRVVLLCFATQFLQIALKWLCPGCHGCMRNTTSAAQGGGKSFRKGKLYRRVWLLWITDSRLDPLMDRKVVRAVFSAMVAIGAEVTSLTTAGCSVLCCSCSCSCSVVGCSCGVV